MVHLMIAAAGGTATHFLGRIQSLTGRRTRVSITVSRTHESNDDLVQWILSLPE